MRYLPAFLNLRDRACLVVGGGAVGERRVEQLAAAGARVTVLAPSLTAGLERRVGAGELEVLRETFVAQPLEGYWLIVAATDDAGVNANVFAAAQAAGRYCNVVDDPEQCSFIMPAVIDRDPITIAISSAGASPTLARWIKGIVEAVLPLRIGALARLLSGARARVRAALPSELTRRHFWQQVVSGPVAEACYAGRDAEAAERLSLALEQWRQRAPAGGAHGEAYLVGAGPGSADLLTLRGRQLLAQADVVLYDRLVNPDILAYARRDAELIAVGKSPRQPSISQRQLNRLLVTLVAAGKRVCRLKGGDPMIFGRVAEELEALTAAGLPFQIVPGVSAAEGCAAYAGLPLTLRGVSHSVVLTTGHTELGAAPDYGALAPGQTLVFYMGVAHYEEISTGLRARGHADETPVAIVENGTQAHQRVLRATLAELPQAALAFGIEPPALLVVGETAHEVGRYSWFTPERVYTYDSAAPIELEPRVEPHSVRRRVV